MLGGEHTLVGFVDDRWPNLDSIWGLKVLGRLGDLPNLRPMADTVVPAIGDRHARQAAVEQSLAVGFDVASIVHPRAFVSPSALLGRGVTVMAGAIIGTEASIGDGVIVNAGAALDHHAHVGAYAHLGVGVCVGGGAVLAPGAWLRVGESLAPGQRRDASPASSDVMQTS